MEKNSLYANEANTLESEAEQKTSVMQEPIIAPIKLSLLKKELTAERKLCDTNKGGNEIYSFDGNQCPNLLKEVGRLRELAFRHEGGGSGLAMDLDEFDTMESPYQQLIVWDPDAQAIIGGYRYIFGSDVRFNSERQPILATTHMFHFSDKFIEHYLPHTLELGRSFVSPDYQSSKAGAKAVFALDNLWDGIASVIMKKPSVFFFFGKMTMYPNYNRAGRDLILSFLHKHYPDEDNLVQPIKPIVPEANPDLIGLILKDSDFKTDYRNLKNAIHNLGTSIPPLVNSYMNISSSMKVFGTAINDEFSDVEETAILVCFDEMHLDKVERHKDAFFNAYKIKVKKRFKHINAETIELVIKRVNKRRMDIYYAFKNKIKR